MRILWTRTCCSAVPEKLLLISTGNITNRELESILVPNIPRITEALQTSRFVELSRTGILLHD